MIRNTSLAAYNYLLENNLLPKLRMTILTEIVEWNKNNDRLCTQIDVKTKLVKLQSRGSVSSRFPELVRQGIIENAGAIDHPGCKSKVMSYRLTGRKVPLPLKKQEHRINNKELLTLFVKGMNQNADKEYLKDLLSQILKRMKGK